MKPRRLQREARPAHKSASEGPREAHSQGQVGVAVDCDVAAAFFWVGWEGAILRARLVENDQPLKVFYQGFLSSLGR